MGSTLAGYLFDSTQQKTSRGKGRRGTGATGHLSLMNWGEIRRKNENKTEKESGTNLCETSHTKIE